MLRDGGNAFDAAAAAVFVLNVTQPHLAGIGGSSNIVVHVAADGRDSAIDARERAPAATTPEMFQGLTAGAASVEGFSVGVPGTLRAVETMLERWGTMSLKTTLGPAIDHAEHGITVRSFLAKDALQATRDPAVLDPRRNRAESFSPETKALFYPNGTPVTEGATLYQPELAKTFKLIADAGTSAPFYRGEIAQAIVEAQKWHTLAQGEGRMTLADLAAYDVDIRAASHLDYRGYDVYSAPPSSCGGLVLLEALGLLENDRFPLGDGGRG